MSLALKIVAGGLWKSGVNYASSSVNLLANILLARLLVPTDFGVFALAMSISEILFTLGGLGLAKACIRLQEEADVFDTTMILAWIIAGVLAFLGTFLSLVVVPFYSGQIAIFLFIICSVTALQFPSSIYSAHMEKEFMFRRSAMVRGVCRSCAAIVGVGFAALGLGPWSLLFRTVFHGIMIFIGMSYFSTFKFKAHYNKETARKVWRFSYDMFFMRLSETAFDQMPKFLLGSLAGTQFLGLFERSKHMSGLPNSMLSPFNAEVGFAVYSRFKEYPSKIAEGVQWNLMLVGHLVLPAGLLVFLFSESILQTVLGAQWVPAAPLLQGFSLFLITLPVYVVLKYVLLARGNVRDVTLTRSISAVFVLAWIGIAYFREGFWQYLPWIISTVILASTVFLAWRCSKIGISIPWLSIFGIPSVLVSLLLVLGIYLRSNGMNALLIMVLFLSLWLVALVLFEHKKMFEIYGRLKA